MEHYDVVIIGAGLAGLQRVLKDNMSARFGIDADSRVLIVITEGDLGGG